MNKNQKILLIRLIISSILWLSAVILYLILKVEDLPLSFNISELIVLILIVISYLLIGYDILFNAVKKIFKGNLMSEDFLMSIASLAAFSLRFLGHREYLDATAIMLFYQLGEFFQGVITEKNQKDIINTMNLKVNICHKENGLDILPKDVNINDIIIVKVGEMVPLDGISLNSTSINKSSLNGEPLDIYIEQGENVLSGSIVKSKPLKLQVTKKYADSTATKILEMVENATIRKTKTEKFISRFARIYTPIVIALAVFLAVVPPMVIGFIDGFSKHVFYNYLYAAILCLVVSCPCALVVSVPLTYFSSIGFAAKNKIIIKGSTYLDKLGKTKTIVMDKTGTLTKATFSVKQVNGDVIEIAKGLEKNSLHPLAQAINSYPGDILDLSTTEYDGLGVIGFDKNDKKYLIGSKKLMVKESINLTNPVDEAIVLYVAEENNQIGSIVLEDTPKKEAYGVIEKLYNQNYDIVVLSGDNKKSVQSTMNGLNIKDYYADLMPDEKIKIFDNIRTTNKKNKRSTVFIGDGINDAPVLSLADVGISMGQLGSDAAIEASDVVVLNDNLESIPLLMKISQKSKKLVIQNIILSIGIKLVILLLTILSNILKTFTVPMELAIFGDVGVLIITILNALRALYIKK